MGEMVNVVRPHFGRRRSARFSQMCIPLEEYEQELADAKEQGREPMYMRDESNDERAPTFDDLPKGEQKKVVKAQADRAKLKEVADAEAAE